MYFIGDANFNNVTGGIEDDIIDGGGGNDTLSGVDGSDRLYGGSGFDSLTGGAGNDLIFGEADDDTLRGGTGADTLDGGLGFDRVTYSDALSGVVVDLIAGGTLGDAAGDVFNSIEQIENSLFNDSIFGNAYATWFTDNQGSDRLVGRADGGDTYSAYAQFGLSDWIGVEIAFGARAAQLAQQGGVALPSGAAIAFRTRADGTNEYDVLAGIDNFYGSSGNDTITGDGRANVIRGASGNDTLDGGAGYDFVSFTSETSAVVVNLGAGTATSGVFTDQLSRFEGVRGSDFGDFITGGSGADRLDGEFGNDVLNGAVGNDHVLGDAGNDVLLGGDGVDLLDGGEGADLHDGGAGSDWATYEESPGGVYVDLLARAGLQLVWDGVPQPNGQSLGDRYVSVENVTGSRQPDYIQGDNGANRIEGLDGDDEIYGCGGVDVIYGDYMPSRITGLPAPVLASLDHDDEECEDCTDDTGENAPSSDEWGDYISGGDGNDLLSGQTGSDMLLGDCGEDTLLGGAQIDILFGGENGDVLEGGASFDILFGGDGLDVASYKSSAAGVNVSLTEFWSNSGGDAAGDLIDEILAMLVTSDAEAVFANALFAGMIAQLNDQAFELVSLFKLPDIYFGIEGLTGSRFNDVLIGDAGDNLLEGGGGDDQLRGGGGIDTASYASAGAGVTVSLLTGQSAGNAGVDSLSSIENLIGGSFNDRLTGNVGTNVLDGGAGRDSLDGGGGDDVLRGGTGNDSLAGGFGDDVFAGDTGNDVLRGGDGGDRLNGGDGSDVLYGGAGNDTHAGGAGQDVFVFDTPLNAVSNADRIADFRAIDDLIRLDNDIFTALATGNLAASAFHRGAGVTTAHDATDRIIFNTTSDRLYYDADGAGGQSATLFATLAGATTVTAADFFVVG